MIFLNYGMVHCFLSETFFSSFLYFELCKSTGAVGLECNCSAVVFVQFSEVLWMMKF